MEGDVDRVIDHGTSHEDLDVEDKVSESPIEHNEDTNSKNETEQKENKESASVSGYHLLKWVPWNDGFVPIITQNENGPCPLLALCNILILKKTMKLTPGETVVTSQQLMDLLGSCLLHSRPRSLMETEQSNYEQNMQDAIAVFPRLLTGLDINVKFNSVIGFEFTQELSIFDLLGIHLYHGWLADPSDEITYPVVIPHSYNQLVEHAINNATSTDTRLAQEALLSQQFLENNASQLTYHGLYELNQTVQEGELCVFFRNNHFNTLLKRNGELMLLVTDFGFLNELGHVWHVLCDIDDSGDFLDANFQISPSSQSVDVPKIVNTTSTENRLDKEMHSDNQISSKDDNTEMKQVLDSEIAAVLQAEEDGLIEQSEPQTSQSTTIHNDETLALHLQEEELQERFPQHTSQSQSTHHHGPPPSSREDYEQSYPEESRRRDRGDCNIL